MDISWTTVAIATGATYVAEVYGSLIGGGSFLVQPVLIAFGIPPAIAIANDVAASTATGLGGIQKFRKDESLIRWPLGLWMVPGTIIGALMGALVLPYIPASWMERGIGVIAIVSALMMLFRKGSGAVHHKLIKQWRFVAIPLSLALGFYMAISGAGIGLFAMILLVAMFGLTNLQGLATSKVFLFSAGLASLVGYLFSGLLILKLLLPMLFACWLAGLTGGWFAMRAGEKWMKPIFIVAVIGFAGWLLVK